MVKWVKLALNSIAMLAICIKTSLQAKMDSDSEISTPSRPKICKYIKT